MERLRTLILRSQREQLSEAEIEELNSLVFAEDGATETAGLLDQLCAFTDTAAFDSLPMSEMLSCLFEDELKGTKSCYADVSATRCEVSLLPQPNSSETQHAERLAKPYWPLVVAASYLIVASLGWSLAKLQFTERATMGLPSPDLTKEQSRGDHHESIAPQ
jgi:hypothetical protein